MKISQEERSAIADIVAQKILENQVRSSAVELDGGPVDMQLVTESVMTNPRVDEAFDEIINDTFDNVTDVLISAISRSMTKVSEHTSVDDVKMFADNGSDQIESITEEVMTGIKSMLEAYAKVFTAIVCEVANETASDESLEG